MGDALGRVGWLASIHRKQGMVVISHVATRMWLLVEWQAVRLPLNRQWHVGLARSNATA